MTGVKDGRFVRQIAMVVLAAMALVLMMAPMASAKPSSGRGGGGGGGGGGETPPPSDVVLLEPLLVVTVRAQGSNRFGVLYWEGATPNVGFDVFRNGTRIARVAGSTAENYLYTDAVKSLRGTFTYKVCYPGTSTCSNSITVVYDSSTETIRYAPTCPTTGTATCIETRE
jgi:hypothetical protein